MAKDNPNWGYARIVGALANRSSRVGQRQDEFSTIWRGRTLRLHSSGRGLPTGAEKTVFGRTQQG